VRSASSRDYVPKLSPVSSETGPPDLKGLRIGVPVAYAYTQTEPEVARVVRKAIRTLGELGAEMTELDLPVLQDYWGTAGVVLISEAAAYHRENMEKRPQDYGDDVRMRLQIGLDMRAVDYIQAARVRDDARRSADDRLFSEVDLLAMPATRSAAVPIDSVTKDDPTLGLTRFTSAFNLTGQPAISVPCGFTEAGLPVGLQLVGRRFDERTVLRAAHAFELATGAAPRHPPVE